MSKLYYFIEPTGYNKYTAAAACGMRDATIFRGFKSKIEEKLFKWHNAWPLNRKTEMPFKGLWFKRFAKEIPADCDYILMAESFHLTYSRTFLNQLRKKYEGSKLCFVFSNPVGEYNLEKVRTIAGLYDIVITFAKDDAEKYGFQYCDVLPFRLPAQEEAVELESDVFFVGKNKGRLNQILSIYETLRNQGLKCKFYIVGVSDEEQKYADDIVYNQPITYEEVLKHVQRTRCILELLQEGCNYVSMKTCEAIHYHKKLLTTNQHANQSSLYNDRYIRIVSKLDDIDKSFIRQELPSGVYESSNLVETYEPLIYYLDNYFIKQ